jgi:hypothetical protein
MCSYWRQILPVKSCQAEAVATNWRSEVTHWALADIRLEDSSSTISKILIPKTWKYYISLGFNKWRDVPQIDCPNFNFFSVNIKCVVKFQVFWLYVWNSDQGWAIDHGWPVIPFTQVKILRPVVNTDFVFLSYLFVYIARSHLSCQSSLRSWLLITVPDNIRRWVPIVCFIVIHLCHFQPFLPSFSNSLNLCPSLRLRDQDSHS